jgi:hypothetical protein
MSWMVSAAIAPSRVPWIWPLRSVFLMHPVEPSRREAPRKRVPRPRRVRMGAGFYQTSGATETALFGL